MKKQELQALRVLKATPEIMKAMQANPLQRKTVSYAHLNYTHEFYEHGLFMRCTIQNDILIVALFLPSYLRTEGKLPAYTLYVSRAERRFITYDHINQKWRTATLHNLDWPTYFYYSKKKWIRPSDYKKIQTYLGEKEGGYEGILHYQNQIREEELQQRHKKETDPWDADLSQVPGLPKDWERWVSKVGIRENYIFYQYRKGGAKTGYCTYCEKEVPIKQPYYNKHGLCPCCRHEVIYKSMGKAGTVRTETDYMYLLQRCRDGFVSRVFRGNRTYRAGEYRHPKVTFWEIARTIHDQQKDEVRSYFWEDYKQRGKRWVTGILNWRHSYPGKIYGKTLPTLAKKELSRTGLPERFRYDNFFDPDTYLMAVKKFLRVEQLLKAGLFRLADDCIGCYYAPPLFTDWKCTSLIKALGINRQQFKRLCQFNGGTYAVKWLQYENETHKNFPDEVIVWLDDEHIHPRELQFIYPKMSIIQIYHYVRRQMNESHMDSKEVLQTWDDYLSMARGLRMDVDDEIVYRVRKLRQRHNELVKQLEGNRDFAVEVGKVLKNYPHADEFYRAINGKYDYANKEFSIVTPNCVEDILHESEALHHCVSHTSNYWERIEHRESFILFLRRTSSPNESYYTLEVEPDGTVRQKRTLYNRQNKEDMKEIQPFLIEWQKEITKRLTEEDHERAKESRILRAKEFDELRANNTIINTGYLQGQPLVDVLLADLLENSETIPEPALPIAA